MVGAKYETKTLRFAETSFFSYDKDECIFNVSLLDFGLTVFKVVG